VIDDELGLLVLATDGIWDVLPNEVTSCPINYIHSLTYSTFVLFHNSVIHVLSRIINSL
jgi:serine/threonine protein phosphatase PrpC